MHGNDMHEEVTSVLARLDSASGEEQSRPHCDGTEPMQDIYVLIVRERDADAGQPAEEGIIEATLAPQKPSLPALTAIFFALLLPVASITMQVYLMLNPFTATVTILPKSQHVTLSGTVQLGRLLPQVTLSQSQTVPTTGKGHQDAKAAVGFITFYNGLFTEQRVAAGTILTGSDGVHIVTSQNAVIPTATADPLAFGQVTVTAQATRTGSSSNIAAYDINEPCCANGILAKNAAPFQGGADERDFQTVSQADIHTLSTLLKTHLMQRLTIALHKQVHQGEVMIAPTCTPTVVSDHRPGEEAIQVTVTVSETCNSAAYDTHELQKDATLLFTSQALNTLGLSYSLTGNMQVTVKQATITSQHIHLVFSSQGTYIYRLSTKAQEHIRQLVAGKSKEKALQLLTSFPGIKTASIHWSGFGDDTRIPKNLNNIHLDIFYGV